MTVTVWIYKSTRKVTFCRNIPILLISILTFCQQKFMPHHSVQSSHWNFSPRREKSVKTQYRMTWRVQSFDTCSWKKCVKYSITGLSNMIVLVEMLDWGSSCTKWQSVIYFSFPRKEVLWTEKDNKTCTCPGNWNLYCQCLLPARTRAATTWTRPQNLYKL